MYESQCLGVQGLPGANGEAVVYKLFVFTEMSSFQYLVSTVSFIIEQYVADVFHVYTYLVRASGFEHTFHEGDIAQTFQYLVMGNGMFSLRRVAQYRHLHAVFGVPSDIAFDGSFVFIDDAPYQSVVFALGGLVVELQA